MKTEDILATEPLVLRQEQREFYFENGYLLLESFVPHDWLERLRAVADEFVEASRALAESNSTFDLEADHTAQIPRLRRLCDPVEHHPVFWEFTSQGPIVDLAADLVGPDVKYHHSKLNFKWRGGGEEVKWHQDIQFWPHSNYSPLTIGVYLDDVADDMAPMGVIPKSHEGELFDLYDENEVWTGAIREADLGRVALDEAVFLAGPAGSVTVHNLPHGARLPAQRVGALKAPAVANLYLGGCVEADRPHRRPGPFEPNRPGQAGQMDRLRSPALPDPPGLVEGLHLDLRGPAGGRGADLIVRGQPVPERPRSCYDAKAYAPVAQPG